MRQILFDKKDRRILAELDKNPRINVAQLAKRIGVSRNVAEYRITKFLSQKTIYAFYTLIDAGMLGYSLYRVHLRLKNAKEEEHARFAKDLFDNYPTFWAGFISGSFDVIADLFAENANAFERLFSRILRSHHAIIQSYDTLTITEQMLHGYGYFLPETRGKQLRPVHKNLGHVPLDEKDRTILQTIKMDCRLSYETIGKRCHLTRNAVKNRIKRLEEKKIIADYAMLINFSHFQKQDFKIFVKYNNAHIDQEPNLLAYLREREEIFDLLKLIGKWNVDIEVHVTDAKALQRFIIELRNKFDIIADYEIIQLIEDYGIDFFPNKLFHAEDGS